MSSNVSCVGDVVSLQRGTTYKSALLGLAGPILLGLASIQRDGGFRGDSLKTYGGESAQKILVYPGELYVSLKDVTQSGDLLGAVARLPENFSAGRLTQDTVKLEVCNVEYPKALLYWALRSPEYRSYCRERGTGTTNLALSREDFLSFPLPEPSRERVKLVKLLENIENRISLLRETNATLESIAQALFKSWFVDFDPVRAKVEGRAAEGIDEEKARLFPDHFENTGDALLPKGWKTDTLAGVTASAGGSIQTGPFGSQLHASDYVDNGVPVVMPKDILGRTVSIASIARTTPENVERLARHKLQPGDIVFSRRGDVERHALISETEAGWLCGTGCLLVRPGSRWPSPTFLSMLLDAPAARTWLVQHAVGATMPNLNTGILGSVPVIVPPLGVLQAFEEIVSVLEARRSGNLATAQTLASLRDALLPRLISGQLRLPQAQEEVEEALA